MMPHAIFRRFGFVAGPPLLLVGLLAAGCSSPLFRGQDPETSELEELASGLEESDGPKRVGDLAVPWGTGYQEVQSVALVTGLNGTGSNPAPSPMLDRLIKEIQTHDVSKYRSTLESDNTSLVLVKGYIPPGAMKKDTFDIEVRVPRQSKTTSLRNGWLMPARLRQIQFLDRLREGEVIGTASGAVLIDSLFEAADDAVAETRGRVPGGGVVRKDRALGLVISDEHSSVMTSARVGAAINQRFFQDKEGVANPKRDNLIELKMHRKYRHNRGRYLRVIQQITIHETPAERTDRLLLLERMLVEPTTSERAALELEAIGTSTEPILRGGLQASDPEVRFYTAEAMAYLGMAEATQRLLEAARAARAFRWRALTALATLETYEARDALISLFETSSAETRYGAFRALRTRNRNDPAIRGEVLNHEFALHEVVSRGEPMIHFSRTRRPEIVVFGHGQEFSPPSFLYAGPSILIKAIDSRRLRVSCFRPGKEDRIEECSTRLVDVIRTISKVGGSYADAIDAIRSARDRGLLAARLEVDAIPRANRRYERPDRGGEEGGAVMDRVAHPVPDMFFDRLARPASDSEEEVPGPLDSASGPSSEGTRSGFFARIMSWYP